MNRRQHVRRLKYAAHLASDYWKAIRKKVLQRARGLCEKCHRFKAVEVHHKTYKNFGHERMEDLQALCKRCHDRSHPWKKGHSFSSNRRRTYRRR